MRSRKSGAQHRAVADDADASALLDDVLDGAIGGSWTNATGEEKPEA